LENGWHIVPIDKGGSGNGGAIFVANGADGKVNPWVTDGTGKGTSELSVAGASPDGLSPTDLLSLGKEVVFTGIDSHFRSQIWVTDGTKIGTKEISVAGLSNPHNYVAMQVAGFEKTFFNGTATFGLTGSKPLGDESYRCRNIRIFRAGPKLGRPRPSGSHVWRPHAHR
jgi:hypothetical protein